MKRRPGSRDDWVQGVEKSLLQDFGHLLSGGGVVRRGRESFVGDVDDSCNDFGD